MNAYPNIAGYKESGTSKRAAQSIELSGRATTLREKLTELFTNGWKGTADEAAIVLGSSPFSIRPRVTELNKQGLISPAGETMGSFGKQVKIWGLDQ